jgi:hypothetical protein
MRREVGAHDLMDAWRLYRCLRRAGPFHVIHGHSSKAGALARISGQFFPKAIIVYTPHAFVTMAPGVSCFYGAIEKILSLFCDAVIVVSDFEKEHALKCIGIDKRKVAVISNGVQTSGSSDRAATRRELIRITSSCLASSGAFRHRRIHCALSRLLSLRDGSAWI